MSVVYCDVCCCLLRYLTSQSDVPTKLQEFCEWYCSMRIICRDIALRCLLFLLFIVYCDVSFANKFPSTLPHARGMSLHLDAFSGMANAFFADLADGFVTGLTCLALFVGNGRCRGLKKMWRAGVFYERN